MGRYDWPAPPHGRDEPFARSAYVVRFAPRVSPATTTPLATKKTRGKGRRALPHNAPVVANPSMWFPIGPMVMENGQAGGHPNVAGRIRDLQIEPTEGNRVYAASAGGGVWFSADAGVSWRPLDDWMVTQQRDTVGNISAALACGAVYVIWGDQADGSHDVVWVGTGEALVGSDGVLVGALGRPVDLEVGGNVAGIGFLNRDPNVSGGSWTVVKGDPTTADPDTLRGESFYRIVGDPQNPNQIVAATSKGLYLKPPSGVWTHIASFASSNTHQPLDVVLTRLGGPDRVRVWVATPSAVGVAEFTGSAATAIDPTQLAFQSVALPGVALETGPLVRGTCLQLATDGSTVYVLGRNGPLPPPAVNAYPAATWAIDATGAIPASATALTGTPRDIFGLSSDQSSYDMCITTHPSIAGRIFIGGSYVSTSSGFNGAIYRCDRAGSAVNTTLVGEGTHPDVHVLRIGGPAPADATKRTVWTGTDGGVFRSNSEGDPGTFQACNNGLAVLQPGFVASHPTNPGVVVAGFQDNGTASRVGDGVWYQDFGGDGGGVVYDPASANRYFRQYIRADWESSDGGSIAPVHRRNARQVGKEQTSEGLEGDSSIFYSGCDATLLAGQTHLAFGSDRVWYSTDWGRSWVTLPTATDPRAGDNPNTVQDVLDPLANAVAYTDRVGSVECCSSNTSGTGTTGNGVITVRLSAAPIDPTSGNLVLRAIALQPTGLVWLTGQRAPSATGPFAWGAGTPLPRQSFPAAPSAADLAALQGGQPMARLPASGIVSDVFVQDPARGALGSCYVATLGYPYPGSAGPIPRDTLWFFDGTSQWLPTGLSTSAAAWPVPADRITAPALAVVVDPDDNTVVYVGTSVGVVQGKLTIGGPSAAPTYQWTWAQLMNGLPEAVVQDLSVFTGSGVKLLRAATQARGVWEVDLVNLNSLPLSYLRLFRSDTRRVLPTPTSGPLLQGDPTNPAHWDDSPDIVIDTTGVASTLPPSEAELAALPSAPAVSPAMTSTDTPQCRVHVLAHHRVGDQTIPASALRVALLRHELPDDGVVALGGLWPALQAAAAASSQPASLPDGWAPAGATLWQNPVGQTVDPRLPRAVSFVVDLSDASGTAVVLLAVVMNTSNQISAADLALGGANQAQTADQLVVASPHVAAKSVYVY